MPQYKNRVKQRLDSLYEAGCDPSVLDMFQNTFSTTSSTQDPSRIAESWPYTQLWWEADNETRDDFEHFCLTIAEESLTLSLAHRHTLEPLPTIPQPLKADRLSLVLDRDQSALYVTNSIRASTPEPYRHEEAIRLFRPQLAHSMAVLGLGLCESYPLEVAS